MLSVVIACYNVEAYVEQAVRSVMNQSLRDVEIICVDDGSTDKTLSIIRDLQKEDSRIKVIAHEKNQGTLAVRVHGVQAASGEYITYLDGDDYLAPETCERALKTAQKRGVDIVQFAVKPFSTEQMTKAQIKELERFVKPCTKALPDERGALVNACYLERRFSWNICCKLIRTEVVRQSVQFYHDERIIMAEDLLQTFMVMVFAEGYAPLLTPCYFYRRNTGVTRIEDHMPVNRIQPYAEEYQAYSLLLKWLAKLGKTQQYAEALEAVRVQVFSDVIGVLSTRIRTDDLAEATKILSAYWPAEDMATLLAIAIPWIEKEKDKADMMWGLRKCEFLQVRTREIKTIGTFYFRMYNGGVERVLSLLIPIWQKAGYRVVLFTEEEPNELDYSLPDDVIRVIMPKVSSGTFEESEKRAKTWIHAIREYDIDVMVYHQWMYLQMLSDSIAIKSAGIPMVLYAHGMFAYGFASNYYPIQYLSAAQKKCYCLFDEVITLSEVDRAWWRALGFRSTVMLNPSTYDIAAIRPASLEGKTVLWVGRLSEEKQIFEALRIMRLVHEKEPEAKLEIVGGAESPEMLERVNAYLNAYAMQDYVILRGYCQDVEQYYKKAALLLWTSWSEGAPMGMVEGKAYGLPIVAYEIGSVDMLRNPKGILVAPQKDAELAAEYIVSLLRDHEMRKRVGQESSESAVEIDSVDLGECWKNVFALAVQQKEEEKLLSQLSPLEASINVSMDFVAKAMDYFGENGAAGDRPLSGYLLKIDRLVNWVLPKGGRRRAAMKKLMKAVFH